MTYSHLRRSGYVPMDRTAPPLLTVVVDTEEEFEWNAPFSRANTSVRAMKHVGRAHAVFDRYGVHPTYVIDYPVAGRIEGVRPLQELFKSRVCTIGALLPERYPDITDIVVAMTGLALGALCTRLSVKHANAVSAQLSQ